jgi:shikimate kinase
MEKITKNYLIYGFKSAGKTTFAKKLSEELKIKHIDLDQEILTKYNETSIFALYNNLQNEFREIEYKIFYNLINNITKNTVLSLGGSTLLNSNIDINKLKDKFKLILIDTDFEIIFQRIQKQETIYKKYNYNELKSLYNTRIQKFRNWSDEVIS